MTRRVLAILALLAGLSAAFAGSPSPAKPAIDVATLAREVIEEKDHVTAFELAQWIHDRRPRLRILDLRSAEEFAELRVPRAERVTLEALLAMTFAQDETVVLLSDGGAHAAQAWVFLKARGQRNVFFLRGGMGEWIDEILAPKEPSELTRYFGGMPRGEDGAAIDAASLRRRGC
jgi:rhodanese-related sulfurtransferase